MRSGNAIAAVLCAAAAAFACMAKAEGAYQYIVAGVPVENPCRSLASSGVPLATGRYARSAESPLEARYRTLFATIGSRLLSTKFFGFWLEVR